MIAETRGASQVQAIQHAGGNHHTCHDEFLRELAHACASAKWLQRCMGRLDQRRFYRQQKYHRAHEAAPQCNRRQEAKASSK